MIEWTSELIEEAKTALAGSETIRDAAELLSQNTGEYVTRSSLWKAFARRGLRAGDYLNSGSRTTEPAVAVSGSDEAHMQIVRAAQSSNVNTLEDLCNRLGISPNEARKRVHDAKNAGYTAIQMHSGMPPRASGYATEPIWGPSASSWATATFASPQNSTPAGPRASSKTATKWLITPRANKQSTGRTI